MLYRLAFFLVIAALAACSGTTSSLTPAQPASVSGTSQAAPGAVTAQGAAGGQPAGSLPTGSASPSRSSPSPAPSSTATNAQPPLAPPSGAIYLGAFVNASGVHGGQTQTMVSTLESQIGRKLALDLHYYGWNATFPGSSEADDAANGRIPVISWNCGASDASVASGAQDANIVAHANALKSYGKPVFLRYLWEMNLPDTADGRTQCYDPGTDGPNGSFSPSQFVAAWNHIKKVFAANGVTNVVWLWNPSSGGADPTPYYPGAQNVDWVGFDDDDANNASFGATFSAAYARFAPLGKPILIGETGATAQNQAAFLQAAPSTLRGQLPGVKGIIYFDAVGASDEDWRLTPDGIGALTTAGRDPYLSATYKP